jgi:hypothetical protein
VTGEKALCLARGVEATEGLSKCQKPEKAPKSLGFLGSSEVATLTISTGLGYLSKLFSERRYIHGSGWQQ